jgi:hypothetical protein
MPSEDGDDPPLAHRGDQLAIGMTYRYPLYIHCGMGTLGEFNNRWWVLVEGSAEVNPEIGAGDQPPPHWPIAQQAIIGTITVIDNDTIAYSIPTGETIAHYQPVDIANAMCK